MKTIFPCVSIETLEPYHPNIFESNKCVPGYVYECVMATELSAIRPGDLVLCLEQAGCRLTLLYNLRNQVVYAAGGKDIIYREREDIKEVKLSIPTTIPF